MASNEIKTKESRIAGTPTYTDYRQKATTTVSGQQPKIEEAFMLADQVLMKKYLIDMHQYEIVPVPQAERNRSISDTARIFKINRLIYDKEENRQEKLLNVYNALYTCGGSVILMLCSDGKRVDVYIGTKSTLKSQITTCQDVLEKALMGNFPGTEISDVLRESAIVELMNKVVLGDEKKTGKSIAAVTSMAGFREGHTMRSGDFVQGLEKLADAMRGEKYTLMVISDPVQPDTMEDRRIGYESLYSQLLPFASTEMTYGQNESKAVTMSIAQGLSSGISEGVALTVSHSHGTTKSISDTTGESDTRSGSNNLGGAVFLAANRTWSKSHTDSKSSTKTNGTMDADMTGKSTTIGATRTDSSTMGTSDTKSAGRSISYVTHLQNRHVKTLLERIDIQLARIDECMDVGMWDCAAYVITDYAQTGRTVASTYQALIRGKESGTETSVISVWHGGRSAQVAEYLQYFNHPLLKLMDRIPIMPTAVLSGEELTVAAGLPQHSLPGISVDTFARFGREISHFGNKRNSDARKLSLGQVYHMGRIETGVSALLDVDTLTAHTFITGSTGSGKSNTVYRLLGELKRHKIPWLVIEPAKGEYKDVFGGMSDVTTFGTNPFKAPNLLKINPFSFPNDVHVLEHIDRLVEIFNACWPMYAAMPAILREAIERSYEECGWNLNLSRGIGVYPDFSTLLEILPVVIDSSAYSADTTSDYKGALITRIRSLTRGIHGMVFSGDVPADEMFSSNAIVDLSRIGSQETKSLIMGILILKLQEYRMSEGNQPNMMLRHVTVLEEAHNLLKKTSSDQSQESSNLAGQAVVMLSNAIAEMRTYGEGFVIADQSPGLMDMSVVRNTNTKIIMRLPDEGDRELVGRAAGLNDAQIEELAGLEMGVAAAFQSDWVEPVLVKVAKFENMQPLKKRYGNESFTWHDKESEAVLKFLRSAMDIEEEIFSTEEKNILRKWYKRLGLSIKAKYVFDEVLNGKMLNEDAQLLVILGIAGQRVAAMPSKEVLMHEIDSIFKGRYGIESESDVIRETHYLIMNFMPDILGQDRKAGVVLC